MYGQWIVHCNVAYCLSFCRVLKFQFCINGWFLKFWFRCMYSIQNSVGTFPCYYQLSWPRELFWNSSSEFPDAQERTCSHCSLQYLFTSRNWALCACIPVPVPVHIHKLNTFTHTKPVHTHWILDCFCPGGRAFFTGDWVPSPCWVPTWEVDLFWLTWPLVNFCELFCMSHLEPAMEVCEAFSLRSFGISCLCFQDLQQRSRDG